jgi:hypothetical protein
MVQVKRQAFCEVCKTELSGLTFTESNFYNKSAKEVLELLFRTPYDRDISVVFTSDQTEGRSCAPYLTRERVTMCPNCYAKLLNGQQLFAYGCQGYNTYYFKEPSNG